MKNKELLEQEISKLNAQIAENEKEIKPFEKQLSDETKKFYEALDQSGLAVSDLENQLKEVEARRDKKASMVLPATLSIIPAVLCVIAWIVCVQLVPNLWITYVLFFLPLVLYAISFFVIMELVINIVFKKFEPEVSNLKKKLEEQKKVSEGLRKDIENVQSMFESKNPLYAELKFKNNDLKSEHYSLNSELKSIKFYEAIGYNNLFVCSDCKHATYGGITSRCIAYIKIDGADRGMIAEPFSIYTLSQGAHSYSIDFYFPGKGEHFYTKEEMLVFNNENAYVSFKSLMYSPSMGLTFERNVYDMKSGYGEDYEKNQSAMRKFASDAYKYNTYDSFSKFENELKMLYRF